jgi:hypothetical protein
MLIIGLYCGVNLGCFIRFLVIELCMALIGFLLETVISQDNKEECMPRHEPQSLFELAEFVRWLRHVRGLSDSSAPSFLPFLVSNRPWRPAKDRYL